MKKSAGLKKICTFFINLTFYLLTFFVQFYILYILIPRLCNGSTSDSGSDCGGSNPPWGTKAERKSFSFFYIQCDNISPKNGSFEYRFSSSPSQGGETGSTPVGARVITRERFSQGENRFYF